MSRIIEEMIETAEGLNQIGLMSNERLDKIKSLSIPKLKPYGAEDIKMLRNRFKLTQNLLAKCLHVSPSLVKKWEQGVRRPTGSSLLALNLVNKNGLKPLLAL